jgi:hypothetical protein
MALPAQEQKEVENNGKEKSCKEKSCKEKKVWY